MYNGFSGGNYEATYGDIVIAKIQAIYVDIKKKEGSLTFKSLDSITHERFAEEFDIRLLFKSSDNEESVRTIKGVKIDSPIFSIEGLYSFKISGEIGNFK
jgi:hypothetical protein